MPEPSKRIWLVNLFFGVGPAPTGALLESIAVGLERHGWQVEVLTGTVAYNKADAAQTRRFHGTVHMLRAGLLPAAGFGGRLVSWLIFYLRVALFAFTHRLPDQVLIMTTPPYMHLVFVVRRWISRRSTRLVLWNQDTYPEVLAAVGILRCGSMVYRFLLFLERYGVVRMDEIIVLDQAMKTILECHGGKYVHIVANWEIDLPGDEPLMDGRLSECIRSARSRYRYLVMYTGNYGWGHDLTILFDYLRQHRDQRAFFFLFVGGGEKWPELVAVQAQAGLDCLAIFPYVPKTQMTTLIKHADFGLVTLERSCVGLMSPSKIHGYLLQGKPLLYFGGAGSNVADAIANYGCGLQIDERDCSSLASGLEKIADGRIDVCDISANARRAGEERYTESVGVAAAMQLLGVAVGPTETAAT